MSENRSTSSLCESSKAAAAGPLSSSFCGYCGERLPATSQALKQCPFCEKTFRDVRPTVEVSHTGAPAQADMASAAPLVTRGPVPNDPGSPTLAAVLSTVCPGLGQVYNGQMFKGVFVFLTCWLVIPWLFGIFDAYVIAKRSQ